MGTFYRFELRRARRAPTGAIRGVSGAGTPAAGADVTGGTPLESWGARA